METCRSEKNNNNYNNVIFIRIGKREKKITLLAKERVWKTFGEKGSINTKNKKQQNKMKSYLMPFKLSHRRSKKDFQNKNPKPHEGLWC